MLLQGITRILYQGLNEDDQGTTNRVMDYMRISFHFRITFEVCARGPLSFNVCSVGLAPICEQLKPYGPLTRVHVAVAPCLCICKLDTIICVALEL